MSIKEHLISAHGWNLETARLMHSLVPEDEADEAHDRMHAHEEEMAIPHVHPAVPPGSPVKGV